MTREAMRAIVVTVAALGVLGQIALITLAGALLMAAAGRPQLLAGVRRLVAGRELWFAFGVAAFATGGSLFFSEVAQFPPCSLCWYERYCMYPMTIVMFIVAVGGLHRVARVLLVVPAIGAGLSVYHLLIENSLAGQSDDCLLSAPGGCGLKWINEFGYVTIPTLALTGFALLIAFLLLDTTSGLSHQRGQAA